MNTTPLMYSIAFSNSGTRPISHEELKRVTNLVIEKWAEEGDFVVNKATPEQMANPWNHVDLNRRLIASRLLKYNSSVVDDQLMIEFNLNEVLDNPAVLKADYWEDKYIQDYNDLEKTFHPLIDDFFCRFGGKLVYIFLIEMSDSNEYKSIPEMKHKLFNTTVDVLKSSKQ